MLSCVQTDASVWGEGVRTYTYLHRQILILLFIPGFGGWEGWINQRKGNWWCLHSPCFSHQHRPEACYLWWWGGEKWKLLVRVHVPFDTCQVPGTAEVFQQAKSLLPTWVLHPGEPGWTPRFFQLPVLRPGFGPDWTKLQFHKDLYMCFTVSSWAAFAGQSGPHVSTCVSVCRTGSQDTYRALCQEPPSSK